MSTHGNCSYRLILSSHICAKHDGQFSGARLPQCTPTSYHQVIISSGNLNVLQHRIIRLPQYTPTPYHQVIRLSYHQVTSMYTNIVSSGYTNTISSYSQNCLVHCFLRSYVTSLSHPTFINVLVIS